MINKQILKKAIEKAVENGFLYGDWNNKKEFLEYLKTRDYAQIVEDVSYYDIIFSHSFAKAFWGENHSPIDYINNIPVKSSFPDWQYHLMQMVLSSKPLKYLEKFL